MSLKVNQGKLDWTPEMITRLVALWGQGVPTSQMARLLGPTVTKNAVIGKVHRLKLPMRKSPLGTHPPGVRRPLKARPPRPSRARAAKAPPDASLPLPVPDSPKPPPPPPAPLPAPPKPIPRNIEDMVVPVSRQIPLLELRSSQCKWPTNSPPRGGVYLFCGEPRFHGQAYCEYHSRIGYAGTKRQERVSGWQPRQTGF